MNFDKLNDYLLNLKHLAANTNLDKSFNGQNADADLYWKALGAAGGAVIGAYVGKIPGAILGSAVGLGIASGGVWYQKGLKDSQSDTKLNQQILQLKEKIPGS